MLVGDITRNNARRFPAKPALIEGDRVHTWPVVDDRACRLGNHLHASGLTKGDRVLVVSRNAIEWPEIIYGLAKAGLVAVPVNVRLAADELLHIREDSGARAALVHPEQLQRFGAALEGLDLLLELGQEYETALREASDTDPTPKDLTPDDMQFILYTSGTTGRSKGVVNTHRGMLNQVRDTTIVTESGRSDVFLATTPFFTAGGMVRTLSWTYLGQTMVIHKRFDPRAVLDEIERSRVTFTTFIPTMLQRTLRLLEEEPERDTSSLRRISYGSAPVPPGLAKEAMERLGCDLQQRYGLTECGGQATILTPQDHREIVAGRSSLATSCGQETPMCEIRIVDPEGEELPPGEVGEIVIRSDANAAGYWNRPEQSARTFRSDGLWSGDLGYLDEDRYLHITGRKTEMIISGGFNVYPAEIERVIGAHGDVGMVAVVGVPDPEWGETPVAVVVPAAPAEKVDTAALTAELTELCRAELAGYKQPRRFEYRTEFPLGPAGKILKRLLAEELGPAAAR
ncbi:class I adenylate-forming enzyme family protein [Streptomyces sulphureus]|uniref:class I adenylate-forming enzyme family protein n=1 Tax=Streptomyces sulphureus TaxID=47758 RepID=UPI00035F08E9|nr:AMP-binding protein [Streptomyces sulphureus]